MRRGRVEELRGVVEKWEGLGVERGVELFSAVGGLRRSRTKGYIRGGCQSVMWSWIPLFRLSGGKCFRERGGTLPELFGICLGR